MSDIQDIVVTQAVRLPVIPLRNTVIFPVLTVPLSVGRPNSLLSLKKAIDSDRLVVVVAQKDSDIDDPSADALYEIGVICRVIKTIQTAEGHQSVIVQGVQRCQLVDTVLDDKGLSTVATPVDLPVEDPIEQKAAMLAVKELAYRAIEINQAIPDEAHAFIEQIEDPSVVADVIASNLQVDSSDKQKLLDELSVIDRLKHVADFLTKEVSVLELSQKIKSDVKGEIDKNQREYYLREQLKAIRKELGDEEFSEIEVDEFREQIAAKKLPKDAKEIVDKELTRLARIPSQSPEYGVVRTYIEWFLELPWHEKSDESIDIVAVRKALDDDHFDLDKVKKRILEYLAVLKLKQTIKGPILCLAGPPGVGKTSLGKSVANALGREFVRISLGGVRDEAEIRGHRRTYIGALPGRIIQGMKKAGTTNPVFVLDEIDKLGQDFRGDPASALLEVLDPEQNGTFSDHYLEAEYDLSNVLFIATANRTDTIPPALYDRMEVIDIEGYTTKDKLAIAKKHLWPKLTVDHGLDSETIEISDNGILKVIEGYTRESGVRSLQRELASVCRGVAYEVAIDGRQATKKISQAKVQKYLGPEKFRTEDVRPFTLPGIVLGMAWTPVGGDLLYIESSKMPGDGKLRLTGQLGDVMQESASVALDYVRSNAEVFGLTDADIKQWDVHLHFPQGAIPKDGPSAGVTILTSLVSLFGGKIARNDVAMTGEITLRGLVLPVGGIKSKVIAAHRAGVRTVLLPADNRKDLDDIPKEIRSSMTIEFLDSMNEYVDYCLREAKD